MMNTDAFYGLTFDSSNQAVVGDNAVDSSIKDNLNDLLIIKETIVDGSSSQIKREPEDTANEEVPIFPEPTSKLKTLKFMKRRQDSIKRITKKYKYPRKNKARVPIRNKKETKNRNSQKSSSRNSKNDWEKNFGIRLHLKSVYFESKNLLSSQFLCEKCTNPVLFPNLVDYLVHTLKIHTACLQFNCTVCSVPFADLEQMTQHFSSHKLNGVEICDEFSNAAMCESNNFEQVWDDSDDEILSTEEKNEPESNDSSKKSKITHFRYYNEDFKIKSIVNEKGSTRFQCSDCTAVYLRPLNCCTHIRNIHRQYLCEFCGKEKVGHKAYLAHKRLTHFYVKCPGCSELFSNFSDFRKHSATEHDSQYSKCRSCEEIVDNEDIGKHNDIYHPAKKYAYNCSTCSYATNHSKHLLEKHILTTHFKEDGEMVDDEKRTYLCPHCAEIFEDHRKFNMHIFQKHGKRCPKCNRKYGKNFDQHVTECKVELGEDDGARFRPKKRKFELADDLSNQCPKCKTVFSCADAANKHMDKYNGSCESYCEHCDRNFQDRKALQTHRRLTCPLTKKGYPCHICNMVLSRPLILKWHIDQHNKKPRFHCATCGSSFYDGNLYRVHSKKCTGPPNKPPYRPKPRDKIFRCSYCPAVFNQRLVLRQHFTDTHPGRNMMECYICGKRFKNVKRVLDHMNIHTGQKPYSCSYCPKTFAKESSVYLHHRTHEKDAPGYSRKESIRKERAKKRPEIQPHFPPIYDFSFRL